jgi:predicted DNA-binding transcriptional regulator AlpA
MKTSRVHMEVRHREGGDGPKKIRLGQKGHFPQPVHVGG